MRGPSPASQWCFTRRQRAYTYHEGTANALATSIGKGKKIAIIYSDESLGRSQLQLAKDYYTAAGFEAIAMELVLSEGACRRSPLASPSAGGPYRTANASQPSEVVI